VRLERRRPREEEDDFLEDRCEKLLQIGVTLFAKIKIETDRWTRRHPPAWLRRHVHKVAMTLHSIIKFYSFSKTSLNLNG
jgi:hypothetical protein